MQLHDFASRRMLRSSKPPVFSSPSLKEFQKDVAVGLEDLGSDTLHVCTSNWQTRGDELGSDSIEVRPKSRVEL